MRDRQICRSRHKAVATAALVCLLVISVTDVYAIKQDRKYIRRPQNIGLIYKDLNVKTEDGYRIETWFFPAQAMPDSSAASDTPLPYATIDTQRRPTVVICNGDAGNMSYIQLFMAMVYTANGLNVVTFDWRGFGESDEFPMDSNYLCYTEMLSYYEAVIEAVAAQPEVDTESIYLLGWSTGAYLSMMTAGTGDNVRGCILRGTPSSFTDAIPLLMSVKGKGKDNLLVPADFPVERMPLNLAPDFHKAIMLIAGSEDERTPQWMSERIYEALPDDAFKRLLVVHGAKHGGMDAPEIVAQEEFFNRTLDFIHDAQKHRQ
ncbi:MAG: alpha/beta fold hydrolase [bacterium]|uniref:Alpha/beta fold hydrolase n=1 Tax=Candidatus Aphodosoma intestinipullorum TaxID=2840674 RepID=A0A940IEN6_9BACT|nr:alpha/beta fold hydrolase [Candidatus Aphodosoma intestinipullorum]